MNPGNLPGPDPRSLQIVTQNASVSLFLTNSSLRFSTSQNGEMRRCLPNPEKNGRMTDETIDARLKRIFPLKGSRAKKRVPGRSVAGHPEQRTNDYAEHGRGCRHQPEQDIPDRHPDL